MTTSHTKPVTAFGFAIIPVSEYQDLVSSNQVKSDRVDELNQSLLVLKNSNRALVAEFESSNQALRDCVEDLGRKIANRDEHIEMLQGHLESEQKSAKEQTQDLEVINDRHCATITELLSQVKKLEEGDRTNNEIIDQLNAEMVVIRQNLAATQKDLATVQEAYRKTLAANSALDKKLGEAIAELSKTEQICNEQTVQIATLNRSKSALIENFDNHKQAVNIELDNHKIAVLKTLKELDSAIRNPSTESVDLLAE